MIVGTAVVIALGIGGWLFLRYRAAALSAEMSSAMGPNHVQVHAAMPVPLPMTSAAGETLSATDAPSAAAASSKPCSVVTRDEMEKILGMKIVKITTSDMTCLFFTDDTSSVEVETTWTGGKAVYFQIKGYNAAPGNLRDVAGIGDEAYFPVTNVLHVLKGDTYVVVNARVYANELATESAIARKVMEKLK
jgi:hypothetical protein